MYTCQVGSMKYTVHMPGAEVIKYNSYLEGRDMHLPGRGHEVHMSGGVVIEYNPT
jgi:hypothetical protein